MFNIVIFHQVLTQTCNIYVYVTADIMENVVKLINYTLYLFEAWSATVITPTLAFQNN